MVCKGFRDFRGSTVVEFYQNIGQISPFSNSAASFFSNMALMPTRLAVHLYRSVLRLSCMGYALIRSTGEALEAPVQVKIRKVRIGTVAV